MGSFGFDPVTQQEFSNPLEGSQDIKYETFCHLVHKCPISKALNIPATALSIMDHCEELGFNKLQLTKALSLLIKNEKPSHYPNCQVHVDNPSNFIDYLCKSVNMNLELAKIKQSLKSIRRAQSDSINETLQTFFTLSYQKSKFSCNNLTEEQHIAKSNKQSEIALTSLI